MSGYKNKNKFLKNNNILNNKNKYDEIYFKAIWIIDKYL